MSLMLGRCLATGDYFRAFECRSFRLMLHKLVRQKFSAILHKHLVFAISKPNGTAVTQSAGRTLTAQQRSLTFPPAWLEPQRPQTGKSSTHCPNNNLFGGRPTGPTSIRIHNYQHRLSANQLRAVSHTTRQVFCHSVCQAQDCTCQSIFLSKENTNEAENARCQPHHVSPSFRRRATLGQITQLILGTPHQPVLEHSVLQDPP